MKILVVGSGAREHALVWKLRQSNTPNQLFVTPGNPGAGELAERFDVPDSDIPGVVDLARKIEADLVVIGPEAPLRPAWPMSWKTLESRLSAPTRPRHGSSPPRTGQKG